MNILSREYRKLYKSPLERRVLFFLVFMGIATVVYGIFYGVSNLTEKTSELSYSLSTSLLYAALMQAWFFAPKTISEIFGVIAFFLHILGYIVYSREVFHSRIRPNVATWMMWLFGSTVEFLTYNAIDGAHWSMSALPFACLLGIGGTCLAIVVTQLRNGKAGNVIYHKPERSDYYLVSFDILAAYVWLGGWGASLANFIAVSTSIVAFIPIWKTTYREPQSENPIPWILWCFAYIAMLGAVATGEGLLSTGLYIYPIYYLILHAVVLFLSLRVTQHYQEKERSFVV